MAESEAAAHEALRRARQAVEPVMRAAVETLPGRLRTIAAYHLGWVEPDGAGEGKDGSGGKLLRPGLVLAAATAAAGRRTLDGPVLAGAAAVELAHNFTLLHDDVIDRDRTRRHRPTAWTVFGAENAILAGDAMLALALRLVDGEATERLADCVIEICDGQYEDCAFEQRDDVTLDECLAMAGKKTGALLGCACALGALSVAADPATVTALDLFGREIGMAFQLTDDLLGIWGDPAVTGKSVGSDLSARKKSLPVVAALAMSSAGVAGTPIPPLPAGPAVLPWPAASAPSAQPAGVPDPPTAAAELAGLYALARDLTDHELHRAADAVDRAGGRAWAAAEAAARVVRAHAHLEQAPGVDQGAARDLRAIAELVTRRSN